VLSIGSAGPFGLRTNADARKPQLPGFVEKMPGCRPRPWSEGWS